MSDIFDQLASGSNTPQAAQSASPAPTASQPSVSAPQQTQQAQAQPSQSSQSGDIFDQLAAQKPQSNQTKQQHTGIPTGTISAVPDATVPDKLKNWANNVAGDIQYGTAITGVGHVLKAMGAHGVYSGNSKAVGDFMASLPLGLLRATKGVAEGGQPGQDWQSDKDMVLGLLDASTIPSGFLSPDAGELAGTGTEAALTQAERAAKAAKGFVSTKMLQPKVQGAIASAIQDTAAEHGITIPEGTNLRDSAQALSNALRSKAHGLYQQLDSALGGTRFQGFSEAIDNLQSAIRDEVGIDPERDKLLSQRLADAKAARDAAIETMQSKGIDPVTIQQADALHRKAMALQDVSKAVRQSTDVHPSQLAKGESGVSSTQVRTKPLWNKMQQLATPNPKYPGSPSRLIQALGEGRAAQLLHDVDSAHLAVQKIIARNQFIKRAATAAGLTGLGAYGYHGIHDLLGHE